MNILEQLEDEACKDGIDVIGYDFKSEKIKGLYCNGTIGLSNKLDTVTEKSCVLAEEIGHHYTTTGDILDQDDVNNRKQELKARLWAYNKKIGLQGIIRAYEARRTEPDEMADFLEVTPEFLVEALKCYRSKYSPFTYVDNYIVFFEPSLSVMKVI